MGKATKKTGNPLLKRTGKAEGSTDAEHPIWLFDSIDKNGEFAFDLQSQDFDHKDFLIKMVEYSSMTWAEIKKQTHDGGKSKHHSLEWDSLSKAARDRILELGMDERTDSLFSFAFNNLLRIIGFRENEFFHAVWYDRSHKFCPSTLKHT